MQYSGAEKLIPSAREALLKSFLFHIGMWSGGSISPMSTALSFCSLSLLLFSQDLLFAGLLASTAAIKMSHGT